MYLIVCMYYCVCVYLLTWSFNRLMHDLNSERIISLIPELEESEDEDSIEDTPDQLFTIGETLSTSANRTRQPVIY